SQLNVLRTVTMYKTTAPFERPSKIWHPDDHADVYEYHLGTYDKTAQYSVCHRLNTTAGGTDECVTITQFATGGRCEGADIVWLKSTREATITSQAGLLLYQDVECGKNCCFGDAPGIKEWTAWTYDSQGRGLITDIDHSDGTTEHTDWDCCHPLMTID